ncbi:transaldolase [Phototrophicus methaneseepsis]|uniref:Transaldolase n=1 Tax=Phototrophicus methaneseepsis TaxID=2710758 RepID=A0A7S8EBS9_9CHLR|nr:transaldolase [Phototrophicus methaneseepsis]QPC84032.1 transaldolase [Phototrophicus methaneseepsis]
MTKLQDLADLGQAIWLDYLRRDMFDSGELDNWIDQGLRGMTSNPSIFEAAIAKSDLYDEQINALARGNNDPVTIYEALAVEDIQNAADHLKRVYDETNGLDGYVSLEANPHLAYDTQGTINEVKDLHERVNRLNVMYKIPATPEGIEAVRSLISDGINVNITLMFSLDHYNRVATAYIDGLKAFKDKGGDLSKVASVASFFVSRVDVILEPMLEEVGADELKGKIAIANTKQVYKRFQEIFSGDTWEELAAAGAHVQRPLWASTSTKSPDMPDTIYVDTLIGPDTVNTMPTSTLEAFIDHGTVARTVDENYEEAEEQLRKLTDYGINLLEVGEQLQREGVDKFIKPFDELLATIQKQVQPSI